MIVSDASAAIAALLNAGPARDALSSEQLHAPHLIDSAVAGVMRRKVQRGELAAQQGWQALAVWQRLGIMRYPAYTLLGRIWELRDNLTACDASYVALAEALGCGLLTCDGRLARASSIRCATTVVPG